MIQAELLRAAAQALRRQAPFLALGGAGGGGGEKGKRVEEEKGPAFN